MEQSMDLLSLISGLGSDPAAMGAIAELLKTLGGNRSQPPQNVTDSVQSANFPQFTAPSQPSAPPNAVGGNQSPEFSPELLSSLLSALGGAGQPPPKKDFCHKENASTCDHVSPDKLFGGKAESENRIRLLNALRPYLCEERRCKLDLILKLLKVAEIGKLSGILNSV